MPGWVLSGRSGDEVLVLRRPDVEALRAELQKVWERGVRSAAVLLLHSYTSVPPQRSHTALTHNCDPQLRPTTVTHSPDPQP